MNSFKQRHAVWQKEYLKRFLLPIFIFGFVVSGLVFLSPARKADAVTSSTLNFQARLSTNSGAVVADGSYSVQFRIYDNPTAGTNWWTETQTVAVTDGHFSVQLGSVTPFGATIPWDQQLWMTMNVNADGEMTPRLQLTAVPYAFRAGALVDAGGNTKTASDFAQLAPTSVQSVNAAVAALRLNQAGTGALLQLQGNGSDVFVVDKTGSTVLGAGLTVGNSSSTTAGTIRWSGADLEVYNGSGWVSLTLGSGGGGGSSNTSPTFVSGVANLAGTATGTATGLVSMTSATAVSVTAGSNTFVAPADGSFRNCTVIGNANRTAGTATLRWRVNGVSVGAGACVINATNVRTASTAIDPGVVSFSAGDTITVVFDTTGLTPAAATDYTVYWSVEYASSATSSYFRQGGNNFGGTAVLGTTSAHGLQLITNNTVALSLTSAGDATFTDSVTVQSGGIHAIGNSTITGTLSGLTGLEITSGGIDNNNNGLTEVGAISGVDGTITSLAGLTIQSASSGDITLDASSGIVNFSGATLRRSAAGTTTFDLNDSADTVFSITNSSGLAVANLQVEGVISGLSFVGDGSALTNLDADDIVSGTLNDSRLSANVALLNGTQTFTSLNTFSSGVVLGNSASTVAGAMRFNGTDFEGYDGTQWLSLTTGSGGGGSNVTTIVKTANEIVNNSIALQNDDELFFPVGANEVWSFRFVVQANSGTTPDLKFAVTAPSGAVCRVSFSDPEGATSNGQYGCGTTTQSIPGNGAIDLYEITGTVTNGANAGNVTLQWAQFALSATDTTVYAGSYVNAFPQSLYIAPPSSVFVQGGNTFGSTAVLGTGDTFGLSLATDGVTRLSFLSTGEATFANNLTLNANLDVAGTAVFTGGVTLGDASGDGLAIVSNSVSLANGLNFDSNTFVIDSATDFVGINVSSPVNRLSLNTPSTVDMLAQAMIATDGAANKGLVVQGATSQTANLFELQNDSGGLLAGFSSDGGLVLGQSAVTSAATAARSILLPDESGTVCLSGSAACTFLPYATGSFVTDATTNDSIAINKTGASGNLLALQKNGGAVFTVANTGALQIQSTGTAALDIRNVGGTSYFSVDTSTGIVRVGPSVADANGVFFILDTKNTTGDPAIGSANNAQYYNSAYGATRCYEDGYWSDCMSTRVLGETTLGSAGNTITVNLSEGAEYLQCRVDIKSRTAASLAYVRFNGDAGAASYGWNTYSIVGTAVQDAQDASDSELQLNGTTTGTVPFSANLNITNFADTRKTIDWTAGGAEAIGTQMNRYSGGGAWDNTTNPITSVSFIASTGNFAAGSHAWCQGRDIR